jgi:hypothetical protein
VPRRLQVRAEATDLASAEVVHAALQQASAAGDFADRSGGILRPEDAGGGAHLVFLEVRARQGRAAPDALRAAVKAQIRPNGSLAGTTRVVLASHECSHGTGDPRPCVEDEVEEIAGPAAGKLRSP